MSHVIVIRGHGQRGWRWHVGATRHYLDAQLRLDKWAPMFWSDDNGTAWTRKGAERQARRALRRVERRQRHERQRSVVAL